MPSGISSRRRGVLVQDERTVGGKEPKGPVQACGHKGDGSDIRAGFDPDCRAARHHAKMPRRADVSCQWSLLPFALMTCDRAWLPYEQLLHQLSGAPGANSRSGHHEFAEMDRWIPRPTAGPMRFPTCRVPIPSVPLLPVGRQPGHHRSDRHQAGTHSHRTDRVPLQPSKELAYRLSVVRSRPRCSLNTWQRSRLSWANHVIEGTTTWPETSCSSPAISNGMTPWGATAEPSPAPRSSTGWRQPA